MAAVRADGGADRRRHLGRWDGPTSGAVAGGPVTRIVGAERLTTAIVVPRATLRG